MTEFSEDQRVEALRQALIQLNAPAEKAEEMARQLDKRAEQLAAERGGSYEQAVGYLIQLMSRGWASPNGGSTPQ